jgi:hypothetical protein
MAPLQVTVAKQAILGNISGTCSEIAGTLVGSSRELMVEVMENMTQMLAPACPLA